MLLSVLNPLYASICRVQILPPALAALLQGGTGGMDRYAQRHFRHLQVRAGVGAGAGVGVEESHKMAVCLFICLCIPPWCQIWSFHPRTHTPGFSSKTPFSNTHFILYTLYCMVYGLSNSDTLYSDTQESGLKSWAGMEGSLLTASVHRYV
jgi:hypothetical protein